MANPRPSYWSFRLIAHANASAAFHLGCRAPQSDSRKGEEVQMSTMPGPIQSELSKSSGPVKKPLVEVLTIDPANLRNDQPESERPLLGKRALLAFAPITFCIGVAVTWLRSPTATWPEK